MRRRHVYARRTLNILKIGICVPKDINVNPLEKTAAVAVKRTIFEIFNVKPLPLLAKSLPASRFLAHPPTCNYTSYITIYFIVLYFIRTRSIIYVFTVCVQHQGIRVHPFKMKDDDGSDVFDSKFHSKFKRFRFKDISKISSEKKMV